MAQTITIELLQLLEDKLGKEEGRLAKPDQKFKFMIILMIIALTLMNPVFAEISRKALKL